MIKEIETLILDKLSPIKNGKIKLIAQPVIDFNDIRQNIIVNLQYVSESFIVPNERKVLFNQTLSTKKRLSDLSFSLKIYYKDLRNNFDDAYDLFDSIISSLHGEVLELSGNSSISPIYIKGINFIERNAQSYLVYEAQLELRYVI